MNEIIKRQLQTCEGVTEIAEASRLLYQCIAYSKDKKLERVFDQAFNRLLEMVDERKYGFEQSYLNVDTESLLELESNDFSDYRICELLSEIWALKKVVRTLEGHDDSSLLKQVISLKDHCKFTSIMIRMSDKMPEDRDQLMEIVQCEELGFLDDYDIRIILNSKKLSNQFKVGLLLNWFHDEKNSSYCCQFRKSYFENGKALHEPLLNYLYDFTENAAEMSQKRYDLQTVVENNLVDLNEHVGDVSIFLEYYAEALDHYDQSDSRNRKLFVNPLPIILSTGNGICQRDVKFVIGTLLPKGNTKEICEFFSLDQYRHFNFDTADFLFDKLQKPSCDCKDDSKQEFLNTLIEQWIELEDYPDKNQALLYLIERSCENNPLHEARQKLHDTLQEIVAPLNSVSIGSYYSTPNGDTAGKKPYVKSAGNTIGSGR